ncbi:dolichyl-phosphate beta-glucosyltransferase [Microbacterium sp.]|uniref:dolichyl-phosphate beta-glucosyltransferase n=1 Tax=Microbacterium sp. TaxID=51671 RepID=UPI003A88E4A0
MYERYLHWRDRQIVGDIDLTVVLPTYNEARRVVPTIAAFAACLSETELDWELIVADDGSTDATREIVRQLGHANIWVSPAPRNAGKGDAVRRGLTAARGAAVLFADADNATPAAEIHALLAELSQGADIVIGSRAAAGADVRHRSPLRRLMTAGLRTVVRVGLGLGVRDTQCGFKLFTAEAAHRIAAAQTIPGFAFDLEELYLARRFGYRVVEVPVTWFDAPGSTVSPIAEAARFVRSIIRIRWNGMRGVYRYA